METCCPTGPSSRYGTLRLHHAVPIVSVAFSPGGSSLVSVGEEDRSVRVWAVPSGKLLKRVTVSKDGTPHAAVFGGATTLFVVGDAPTCTAWDLNTDRRLFTRSFDEGGTAVARSPDGKTLAVGLAGGRTVLLDGATGAEKATLEPAKAEEGPVTELAFTPDGTKVAIAHMDGMVRLWDLGRRKRSHTFPSDKGAEGVFRGMSMAPDGRSLLFLTDDRVLHYDLQTGKPIADFISPMADVAQARFSPDGKQIVALGNDGRVLRWEAPTGKAISETKKPLFEDPDTGVADFDPAAGVAALVRDTSICLIDLRSGKLLTAPTKDRTPLLRVRLTASGEAACLGEDGSRRVWDPTNGRPKSVERLRAADDPPAVLTDLAADAKRVATVDDAGNLRIQDSKKELWKTEPGDDGMPTQIRFSPDGALLAVASEGTVRVLDSATGKKRTTISTDGEGDCQIAWSRDSRMLIVADATLEEVSVWELATGLRRQTFEVKEPSGVAVSPDSRRLAVVGANGVLRLFGLGTDAAGLEVAVVADQAVGALVFSPDGSRLAAAAGDTVRVWDADGKPFAVFRGHDGDIHDLVFAPDGRTLISASQDGTALVWDVVNPVRPAPPRKAEPFAVLWQALGDEDAMTAFRAVATLRETPAETVAFLKDRLSPAKAVDPKSVERMLANLENDDFATREKAVKQLEALDAQVLGALRTALAKKPEADTRMWLKTLIEKAEGPPTRPDQLRELRAVEVLEYLATAEARALLEALAAGADARLTREASAAVRRLKGK